MDISVRSYERTKSIEVHRYTQMVTHDVAINLISQDLINTSSEPILKPCLKFAYADKLELWEPSLCVS